ncbi:hypothetical protein GEMRC1_011143 [Eukaryota sp. GEM-RC1]
MPQDSSLYAPHKIHGSVATGALAVHSQGKTSMIAAATHQSFIVYSSDRLRILYQGPPLPGPITDLIWVKRCLVIVVASSIYTWTPGHQQVKTLSTHDHPISAILSMSSHFLSYSPDGCLRVWEHHTLFNEETADREYSFTLAREHSVSLHGTTLFHPVSLLNKVIIAGKNGMDLYNFRSGKLLHSFSSLFPGSFSVTSIAQSPIPSIIGVAFTTDIPDAVESDDDDEEEEVVYGPQFALLNISLDEVVLRSPLTEDGVRVVFRTDGPCLIHVLTRKCRLITISLTDRTSHITRISGLPKSFDHVSGQTNSFSCDLHGVPGRPLLYFSGFKFLAILVFDDSQSETSSIRCRILRSRLGLFNSPGYLLSLNEDDTSSGTRVITFTSGPPLELSLTQSHQSTFWTPSSHTSISQCLFAAQGLSTSSRWPALCSVHEGQNSVRIWNAKTGVEKEGIAVDNEILGLDVSFRSEFVALAQTNSKGSLISVYRLESKKLSFSVMLPCHVSSIKFDLFNRVVICSGVDGNLYFVDTRKRNIKNILKIGESITAASVLLKMSLLAVVTVDGVLSVIDINREVVIRQLRLPSRAPINHNAIDWSRDGRTVFCGSLLGEIFVFDVLSNTVVDAWICQSQSITSPITALILSESGSILTCHPEKPAVFEWYDRSKYEVLPRRPITNVIPHVNLPGEIVISEDDSQSELMDTTSSMSTADYVEALNNMSKPNIESHMIHFSDVSSRVWRDLPLLT